MLGVAIAIPQPHATVLVELAPAGRRPGRRPRLPARDAAAADAGARRRRWTRSRSTWPQAARGARPFVMHLAGTGTFRPTSPVVFIQVATGVSRLRAARARHPQRAAGPRARLPVPPARHRRPGHRRRRAGRGLRRAGRLRGPLPVDRFVLFSRDPGDGGGRWRTRVPAGRCDRPPAGRTLAHGDRASRRRLRPRCRRIGAGPGCRSGTTWLRHVLEAWALLQPQPRQPVRRRDHLLQLPRAVPAAAARRCPSPASSCTPTRPRCSDLFDAHHRRRCPAQFGKTLKTSLQTAIDKRAGRRHRRPGRRAADRAGLDRQPARGDRRRVGPPAGEAELPHGASVATWSCSPGSGSASSSRSGLTVVGHVADRPDPRRRSSLDDLPGVDAAAEGARHRDRRRRRHGHLLVAAGPAAAGRRRPERVALRGRAARLGRLRGPQDRRDVHDRAHGQQPDRGPVRRHHRRAGLDPAGRRAGCCSAARGSPR